MSQKAAEDPWKDAQPCCKGCIYWSSFKKDCHYFWEGKKHCTMWSVSFNQNQQ